MVEYWFSWVNSTRIYLQNDWKYLCHDALWKVWLWKIESWHIRSACSNNFEWRLVSFKLVNKKGYRRVSKGQDHHLKSHSVAAALSRFDLSYLVTSTNSVHVMISITFDRILTLDWRSISLYSRVTNNENKFYVQ